MPFANGAPNLAVDFPAAIELARQNRVAIAGKDFKTGQTLIKTVLAPGLKARMLGIDGWFSTNILGNRDGEVLDDPGSFRSKEVSKLGVLDYILQPEVYPQLYGELYHKVRIEYYPPRGDAKEGWDNVDLFGWLGYPMQMKVNLLCRDARDPRVAELLLQGPDDRAVAVPGARSVHSADEAREHHALAVRRAGALAPRPRIL